MRTLVLLIATSLLLPSASSAQDPFASNVRPTEPLPPEEQLKTFHLPEGFEIQLVAAEPDIYKPMNMAFDAQGRLWVTNSIEYPYAAAEGAGHDKVTVLQDRDGDGRAEQVTTFVDDLNIPMGLYPYRDGVVVYSMPNIWFLRDTDGDGKCDKREVLYGQLGMPVDTHGMQNAFRRGFDGWLYVCHGFRNDTLLRGRDGSEVILQSGNTYRIQLDGSRVEQFTWGQVNPFGSTFTPEGDLITADCHSKPLTLLLRGGYFTSFGKPHDGLGFVPSIMEHGHGSTAICGTVYYDGNGFPEPYRNSLFVGNVMTSRVHRDALLRHGSSVEAQEALDFLTCDDPWFRPVDLQIGPDGALYIADFYNRIIGHYEVPLDHPGRDRERARIWRVVYKGRERQPQAAAFSLATADVKQLIEALDDTSLAVRSLATDQLTDRIGQDAATHLQKEVHGLQTANGKVHALWALHRLGQLEDPTLVAALTDLRTTVRIHALRILSELSDWSTEWDQRAVAALADRDPLVRRAAADALGQHSGSRDDLFRLLDAWRSAAVDDVHLRHNIMIALRNRLREPGAISALVKQRVSTDARRLLCRIMLAVPSAEAADFLLAALREGIAEPEQTRDYLQHVAAHVEPPGLDALVALVRQQAADDVDYQLELIQLLQRQLVQRGQTHTPKVESWGRELVQRIFKDQDGASAWINLAAENPWGLERRNCADGQERVLFLSSLPGGERQTAVLRSKTFELPPRFTFYLCGHLGFPDAAAVESNYVRLCLADGGQVLQQALPPRNDTAAKVEWDLAAHAGQRGYLEIVDGLALNAFAWLAVSRFEPAVVDLPAVPPRIAAQRLQAAAMITGALRLSDLEPTLVNFANAEGTDVQVRAACVETLLMLQPNPLALGMRPVLRDATVNRDLQRSIAAAIVARDDAQLRELSRLVMRSVPTRLQEQMAESLVQSAAGADLLLQLTAEGLAAPRLLQRPSIQRSLATLNQDDINQRVAKLTENLAPLNEQLAQAIQQRREAFSKATVSAPRGRELFVKHCGVCHQVSGQGAMVGPQLDGIGNRGAERILEDVLDPKRNIDAAFHVSQVVTTDGAVLTGLFRRVEGQTRVFAGKDGKEFSLLANDIDTETKSPTSIMPDNVATLLSEPEFCDLLAYLISLRK